jgi:predicted nucleic acid-binding protein
VVTNSLLVDSSVWIALLRGQVPALKDRLAARSSDEDRIVMCEPIALELVAGAGPNSLPDVERLVDGLPSLALDPALDFRVAADLARRARRAGRPVRSSMDCLIAAVAVRHDAVLVHHDRDFDVLASVSSLRAERWG